MKKSKKADARLVRLFSRIAYPQVDGEATDKEIDKHFSKRKTKTIKFMPVTNYAKCRPLIEDLLTEKQKVKLKKWKNKQGKTTATIGGRFTYKITPTGLGLIIIVEDNSNGKTINLTESENW